MPRLTPKALLFNLTFAASLFVLERNTWATSAALDTQPILSERESGGDTSGGGDSLSQQFTAIGLKLVEYWALFKDDPLLSKFSPKDLLQTIQKTEVRSTQAVLVQSEDYTCSVASSAQDSQKHKTACNSRRNHRIIVNRDEWDAIPLGSRRAALVLREYLQLQGIDDENYRYSSRLYALSWLNRTFFDSDESTSGGSEESDTYPFGVGCWITIDGKPISPVKLPTLQVGPTDHGYDYAHSLILSRTDDGRVLSLSALTGADGITGHVPLKDLKIRRPALRLILARSSPAQTMQLMDGNTDRVEVLALQDYRMTGDFEAQLLLPALQLEVRCKRLR